MQKRCNQCNSLTREEALQLCVHDDCPNKQEPEVKQVFIELTAQDLIDNPELVHEGFKVGDKLIADNAGNTAFLAAPEPYLPPAGITSGGKYFDENKVNALIDNISPDEGDPGDEQPIQNRSIIGKIADFITGK